MVQNKELSVPKQSKYMFSDEFSLQGQTVFERSLQMDPIKASLQKLQCKNREPEQQAGDGVPLSTMG